MKTLIIAILISFVGLSAKAQDFLRGKTKEVSSAFSQGSLVSEKIGTTSYTRISVRGSGAFMIKPQIMAGIEAGFYSNSGGSSSSGFNLVGFGVYNFERFMQNSMYVKGGAGMFSVETGTGSESKFGFFVGGGKRFPLWDKIHFSPEARLYKKGDLDPSFEIQALNFSAIF